MKSESEIPYFNRQMTIVGGKEYILWFQISMYDSIWMDVHDSVD